MTRRYGSAAFIRGVEERLNQDLRFVVQCIHMLFRNNLWVEELHCKSAVLSPAKYEISREHHLIVYVIPCCIVRRTRYSSVLQNDVVLQEIFPAARECGTSVDK